MLDHLSFLQAHSIHKFGNSIGSEKSHQVVFERNKKLRRSWIPLTAGFAGKVAVFLAAVDADYLWLVILALIAAVAGLFFYLRVIVIMYMRSPEEDLESRPGVAWGTRVVLAVASAVTIVFGIAPWPLLDVVRDALPL